MNMACLLLRLLVRSVLVTALLASSGCALLVPEAPAPATTQVPAPMPAPEPQVEPVPVAKPAPVKKVPPTPQVVSARVAVVLTSSLPAYIDVADALQNWLQDYRIYDLDDRSRSPRQVFNAIADYDAQLVVAIGLGAAKSARTFSNVPVVFSQVFNVSDNRLDADLIRGVSMLPPMDLYADAWLGLDPKIRDVGAIIGEGHEALIAEVEQAMSERGISLHYAVAKSDRETIYHFKRLIRDLDGYMLFPDNRILSREVFGEIMSEAARHHVQVSVFNESLLKHGATFSASTVESNIADKIAILLNDIDNGDLHEIEKITALSEIRIRVNPAMVRTFGLDLSGVETANSMAEAQ